MIADAGEIVAVGAEKTTDTLLLALPLASWAVAVTEQVPGDLAVKAVLTPVVGLTLQPAGLADQVIVGWMQRSKPGLSLPTAERPAAAPKVAEAGPVIPTLSKVPFTE